VIPVGFFDDASVDQLVQQEQQNSDGTTRTVDFKREMAMFEDVIERKSKKSARERQRNRKQLSVFRARMDAAEDDERTALVQRMKERSHAIRSGTTGVVATATAVSTASVTNSGSSGEVKTKTNKRKRPADDDEDDDDDDDEEFNIDDDVYGWRSKGI
jgi:hypothetical protein